MVEIFLFVFAMIVFVAVCLYFMNRKEKEAAHATVADSNSDAFLIPTIFDSGSSSSTGDGSHHDHLQHHASADSSSHHTGIDTGHFDGGHTGGFDGGGGGHH